MARIRSPGPTAERNAQIYQIRVTEGTTFKAIGARFGIVGERARAIFGREERRARGAERLRQAAEAEGSPSA